MVKFEGNDMVILIENADKELWIETILDLLDLLYCQDDNFLSSHRNTLLFLKHMMPTCTQIG